MEKHHRDEIQEILIGWAVGALARWAGVSLEDSSIKVPLLAGDRLLPYGRLLSEDWRSDGRNQKLQSIFSLIKPEDGELVTPHFVPARPLSLETLLEAEEMPKDKLWAAFAGEFALLSQDERRFETFGSLFYKYAWAIPCSYSESGVSLYEEFKTLSALVYASGGAEEPANSFLLVGGDISGIQDFVYTITSKGAVKALRGRSFFLQLLGDAIVRRLVTELELALLNVVYAAGGNFVLLAPAGPATIETIKNIRRQVNIVLLEAFQGDTALVLEAVSVLAQDLFTAGAFGNSREALGKRVAEAKNRPLAELAADWERVFDIQGRGSEQACTVCRVEVDGHNSKLVEPTGELTEGPQARICYACDSFGQLARGIRHADLWATIRPNPDLLGTPVEPTDGWDKLLARMTGFEYAFSGQLPGGGSHVLAVNRPDRIPAAAHEVQFMANVTPTVTKEDLAYLREKQEELPREGDIRSFTLLAHAAAARGAIERVGVLRMDVDNLGWILSQGIADLTMPKLSTLSRTLDMFFSGYLKELVQKRAENDLYVIYAGGDDLFIVGAWQQLPELAGAIYKDFKTFTGNHPAMSLSGGLGLEDPKFPLYRAAERSGAAEHQAKDYNRTLGGKKKEKEAFCFLGTVIGWEEWELVQQQKDNLLWLIGQDGQNQALPEPNRESRLPRALLQVVQSVHELYRTGLAKSRRQARAQGRPAPNPRSYWGRWVWMHVYQLARMANQKKDAEIAQRVEMLQAKILEPQTVRLSGIAARWAEYLTRGG